MIKKKSRTVNALGIIWDKIVDNVEFFTAFFSCCALVICIVFLFFSILLFSFVLLSNGLEIFHIYCDYFSVLWQTYQIPIAIIITLAIVGIVNAIKLGIGWEDIF